ncbi:hypothetical protein PspLS_09248 [Pyricularia sp. CBS 133598]|nr:hypothetical protein PspLS_09248 [Pyricularia sp. CBS 133598]
MAPQHPYPQQQAVGWSTLEVAPYGAGLHPVEDQPGLCQNQPQAGLQVVPSHDLQVISSPEEKMAAYAETTKLEGGFSNLEHQPNPYQDHDLQSPPDHSPKFPPDHSARSSLATPLWRQRRCWAALALILALIIGVVLGIVFGVVLRKSGGGNGASSDPGSDSNGSSGNNPSSPAVITNAAAAPCSKDFCQKSHNTLVEEYSAPNKDPVVHLFVRDSSQKVQHLASQPGGKIFDGKWVQRLEDVFSGSLSSTLWAIGATPTITVFGLAGNHPNITGQQVTYRHISLGGGDSKDWPRGWLAEPRFRARGPPTACSLDNSGINGLPASRIWVWNLANFVDQQDRAAINFQQSLESGLGGAPGDFYPHYISELNEVHGQIGAAPGVLCRNQVKYRHDVVVYGNESGGGSCWYRGWEKGRDPKALRESWIDWKHFGGKFHTISRPVLIVVGENRFDFLGVGVDGALYHWNFKDGDFSSMESQGGSLASDPVAVVIGTGNDRLDVVAIGKADGRLKRKALVGTSWEENWVDIGVTATSVELTKIRLDEFVMSVIDTNGAFWFTIVKVDNGQWGKLEWTNIPGVTLLGAV